MLCYCKKCGRMVQESRNKTTQICDYCNNTLEYVPEQFLIGKRGIAINDSLKEQFINEYIKSSPEFDQYLFEHRDQDMFNKRMSNQAKMAHGKAVLEEASRRVTCSYCGSSNVKKITVVNKAVHTSIFGIWSMGRNAKNYHCNNCGSDF